MELQSSSMQKNNQLVNSQPGNIQLELLKINEPASNIQSLPIKFNYNESFQFHHLNFQKTKSIYANKKSIKKRQILEHNRLQEILNRGYGSKVNIQNQLALKAHLQRTMLQILQQSQFQLAKQGKHIQNVKNTILQKYLFQINQVSQFLNAGIRRFSRFISISEIPNSSSQLVSDFALMSILKHFRQKIIYSSPKSKNIVKQYQQKQQKQDKHQVNLLNNFPSKCFSSPQLFNLQTILSDLKFLIDQSHHQFSAFKQDMESIFGKNIEITTKVQINKQNSSYNPLQVRQVLMQWVEMTLNRNPNIFQSKPFLDFIKLKGEILDCFHFKNRSSPFCHKKVIKSLCSILQAAKYDPLTQEKDANFGCFIYNFLECKVEKNSYQQMQQAKQKYHEAILKSQNKKIQMLVFGNTLKSKDKQLKINFRYGQVLVGEINIVLNQEKASPQLQKVDNLINEIKNLESSMMGATCQMILQWEDNFRQDLIENLYLQGSIQKRSIQKPNEFIKRSVRKCYNNHQMTQLKGNYFIKDQNGQYKESSFQCDYCLESFQSKNIYDYCYRCSIVLCNNCNQTYAKLNLDQVQLTCKAENIIPKLNSNQQLNLEMKNCPIILFYLSDSVPSDLLKDFVTYTMTNYKMRNSIGNIPKIYLFCCDKNSNESVKVCQKYSISQFPSIIVFDKNSKPQTTLIGANWTLFQGLILVQNHLIQGLPKSLQVTCLFGDVIHEEENTEDNENFCLYCGNARQEDQNFTNNDVKVFKCQNNHYICMNCGFFADSESSKYIDYRGMSYLSEKVDKTQQKRFNETKHQLINHSVETIADQALKCICKREFKKVYFTRDYKNSVFEDVQQNIDISLKIVQSVFKPKIKQWVCIVCKQNKEGGQLHLACFLCPSIPEKINIQICMQCAYKTEVIGKNKQEQNFNKQPIFKCKQGHPVIKTRQVGKTQELIFNCCRCKQWSYIYTDKYYCKQCKAHICLKCAPKLLQRIKPLKCIKTCIGQHELKLLEEVKLKFCNGCNKVIHKCHFNCDICDYDLCMKCCGLQGSGNANVVNTETQKN